MHAFWRDVVAAKWRACALDGGRPEMLIWIRQDSGDASIVKAPGTEEGEAQGVEWGGKYGRRG